MPEDGQSDTLISLPGNFYPTRKIDDLYRMVFLVETYLPFPNDFIERIVLEHLAADNEVFKF